LRLHTELASVSRSDMTSYSMAINSRGDKLVELFKQVKILAKKYYELTGKPLGVTGEVGEFEVARLLGVQLCGPRQPGHDGLRLSENGQCQLSIKSVRFPPSREASWRIGTIDLEAQWDAVLMVLLDLDFEPREIWEADRVSAHCAPGITRANRSQGKGIQENRQMRVVEGGGEIKLTTA